MANEFYVSGERRAARVGELFAAIAPRYDLINDLQSFGLHRWWKRRLVQLAAVRPGEAALDLCCGTGDLAFALADAGARVTGVDFSAPMLAVAEARKEKGKMKKEKVPTLGSVDFLQGDALNLPFPAAHFSLVTVGYGLRNLADLDAGLPKSSTSTRPPGWSTRQISRKPASKSARFRNP
jgi:demethylmenaquinone methyltransferase/2-methoxy-6-polyprenyl-1,4-benzoquinol methylase